MPEPSWPILARPAIRDAVVHALAARPVRAHLLTGIAGTGKTTLLDAVGARLRAAHREVVPVVGIHELSGVPLGAFLPVLSTSGATAESLDLQLHALLARLARNASRTVLAVDDAPMLDELSAAAVYQLVRVLGVPAVMTARHDVPLPEPLERMRSEGLLHTTVVRGLDHDELGRLLDHRLGRGLDPSEVNRLWERTEGNPLFLRALVEGAVAASGVHPTRHGLTLDVDDAGDVTRLADRILHRSSPEERRVAQLLALAGALDDAQLREAHATAGVGALRARGLVETDRATGRTRLHHPLLAEAARRSLTAETREERVREAARLLSLGGDNRSRLAATRLLLNAGVDAPTDQVVAAAEFAHALGDHHSAVDLARTATSTGTSGSAWWTLGASLSLLGHLEEADAAFESGWRADNDDDELALGVSRHGEHLAFRRHDLAGAIALLDRAARLPAAHRAALEPEARIWRTIAGHLDTAGGTSSAASAPPAVQVRAAMAAVLSDSLRGDAAAARTSAETIAAVEHEYGALDPLGAAMIQLEAFFRHLGDADGDAAWDVVDRQRTGAVTDAAGMWSYTLGIFCSYAGRLAEAARLAELAVDQLRWRDPTGLLGAAIALRAVVACARADSADAAELLATLDPAQHGEPRAAMLLAECRAWRLAASGNPSEAAEFLAEVGAGALQAGYGLVAALTMSLALRLGSAVPVAPVLAEAAAQMPDNRLVIALRDLAHGVLARDEVVLLRSAEVVARAGMRATARDALAFAAEGAASASSRRLRERALQLGKGIDARPLHGTIAADGAPSARELATAGLAAKRLSNAEIAAELGISERTVENHLSRYYAKTGQTRQLLRQAGEAPA